MGMRKIRGGGWRRGWLEEPWMICHGFSNNWDREKKFSHQRILVGFFIITANPDPLGSGRVSKTVLGRG